MSSPVKVAMLLLVAASVLCVVSEAARPRRYGPGEASFLAGLSSGEGKGWPRAFEGLGVEGGWEAGKNLDRLVSGPIQVFEGLASGRRLLNEGGDPQQSEVGVEGGGENENEEEENSKPEVKVEVEEKKDDWSREEKSAEKGPPVAQRVQAEEVMEEGREETKQEWKNDESAEKKAEEGSKQEWKSDESVEKKAEGESKQEWKNDESLEKKAEQEWKSDESVEKKAEEGIKQEWKSDESVETKGEGGIKQGWKNEENVEKKAEEGSKQEWKNDESGEKRGAEGKEAEEESKQEWSDGGADKKTEEGNKQDWKNDNGADQKAGEEGNKQEWRSDGGADKRTEEGNQQEWKNDEGVEKKAEEINKHEWKVEEVVEKKAEEGSKLEWNQGSDEQKRGELLEDEQKETKEEEEEEKGKWEGGDKHKLQVDEKSEEQKVVEEEVTEKQKLEQRGDSKELEKEVEQNVEEKKEERSGESSKDVNQDEFGAAKKTEERTREVQRTNQEVVEDTNEEQSEVVVEDRKHEHQPWTETDGRSGELKQEFKQEGSNGVEEQKHDWKEDAKAVQQQTWNDDKNDEEEAVEKPKIAEEDQPEVEKPKEFNDSENDRKGDEQWQRNPIREVGIEEHKNELDDGGRDEDGGAERNVQALLSEQTHQDVATETEGRKVEESWDQKVEDKQDDEQRIQETLEDRLDLLKEENKVATLPGEKHVSDDFDTTKPSTETQEDEHSAEFGNEEENSAEFSDFPDELMNLGQKIGETANALGHLFYPSIKKTTEIGKRMIEKSHEQVVESFSPLIGREYAPMVATLICYGILILPLGLVVFLFERIRAALSLHKVILYMNIYLAIYFAVLLLVSLAIRGEPMAVLAKYSRTNYMLLQILQAVGYAFYFILQNIFLISTCSSEEFCQRLLALIQWVAAGLIGLHYYVLVFHRAMIMKQPQITWEIYGIYSFSFTVLSILGSIRRGKKQYVRFGDDNTDKKN